ncbi:hypothetical protein H114_00712 [Streptomyces gancidicus BKS 13-15]|uniref:Uncharacterized protein n=1 Tax=Streptomyces gancidicus BKS 13-15 TaxID=1284664 RepID=M3DM92_STREZ|nr:hypothetical protein [Streptomyces gancidicus]EMF31105.1 hypothetical protein H114_00712 [Streptomyces gancidicus BKS 13-15]
MQHQTPEQLRDFLRLCLNPGPGRPVRTPHRLLDVLPEEMHDQLAQHAPHLRHLRERTTVLAQELDGARKAYADALAAWIRGDSTEPRLAALPLSAPCWDCTHTLNWHDGQGRCTCGECGCDRFQPERYVIGRSGAFATLYDWKEHRLVVDNATEEHCRRVRDELLAAAEDGPCAKCGDPIGDHLGWARGHLYEKPQPSGPVREPLPLLEAVTVAYERAVAHIDDCTTCQPGMRLAEMCPDGQRTAVAAVRDLTPDETCAHVAWEVTSEHRNELGTWTQFRRCADCPERLPAITSPEPHFGDARPART